MLTDAHTTTGATRNVASQDEQAHSGLTDSLRPPVYTVTEPGGAVVSVHGDSDAEFWAAYDAMKQTPGRQLWRDSVLLATQLSADGPLPRVEGLESSRGRKRCA